MQPLLFCIFVAEQNYYGICKRSLFSIKNLANKDERGFITPKVFNTFTTIAQNKIFNDLFNEMTKAQTFRARNVDAKTHQSYIKRLEEDLAFFSKEDTVAQANGVFAKPEDLSRIISMRTAGAYVFGTSTATPIDVMYDESKIEYILQSDLSAPSATHPVAIVSNDIEVFPTSVKRIKVKYYKYPEGRNVSTNARTPSSPRYNAIKDGSAKISWRWTGDIFEEDSQGILNNSIVVRSLQELGVDSIEALKYYSPAKLTKNVQPC